MESFNSILDSPSRRFLHVFTTNQAPQYPSNSTIPAPGKKRKAQELPEPTAKRTKLNDEHGPGELLTNPTMRLEKKEEQKYVPILQKTNKTTTTKDSIKEIDSKMATKTKTRVAVRPPWKP